MLGVIAASAAIAMLALLSTRASTVNPVGDGDGLREAVFRSAKEVVPTSADSAADSAVNIDTAAGNFIAVVIAQAADCDGNLSSFGIIDRRSIKPFIPHRLLLIEGSARDTIGLRYRLPAGLRTARVELLSNAQRSTLRALGHNATPAMLLFSRDGQLRYAGAVSGNPVSRTVERDIVTRLVSNYPGPLVP